MNILIFAAYYHPHIGGYERNIHEMAKRLVQKGHWVGILTCNTNNSADEVETVDGVDIKRLKCIEILNKTYPIPILKYDNWVKMFTRNYGEVNVVITQTRFCATSLLGLIYAKVKHLPLIHVERGTCHSVVSNPIVRLLSRMYDHTIGSYIVRSAKVNIGISKSACDFIRHLGGKNCIEICNGVDTEIFN